jgi:predicted nucleic acid-binding protein
LRLAADSSVCIPALLEDHAGHALADAALSQADLTIAHAALETYSVLTRLPPPLRLSSVQAATLIDARMPAEWITLGATAHAEALKRLAGGAVAGGAAYDGIIALAAASHHAELLTLDKRASRTYRRLGVAFSLLAG